MSDRHQGAKVAKKARQIYRTKMANEAREMGQMLGNALKPKPRWVPWKLWMLGLGIFIRIKK